MTSFTLAGYAQIQYKCMYKWHLYDTQGNEAVVVSHKTAQVRSFPAQNTIVSMPCISINSSRPWLNVISSQHVAGTWQWVVAAAAAERWGQIVSLWRLVWTSETVTVLRLLIYWQTRSLDQLTSSAFGMLRDRRYSPNVCTWSSRRILICLLYCISLLRILSSIITHCSTCSWDWTDLQPLMSEASVESTAHERLGMHPCVTLFQASVTNYKQQCTLYRRFAVQLKTLRFASQNTGSFFIWA